MIARVWHGVVPLEKADGYGKYLADSDLGVRDYQRVPGNCGVCLLRRVQGDRVHFLLISLWDSREAIEGYYRVRLRGLPAAIGSDTLFEKVIACFKRHPRNLYDRPDFVLCNLVRFGANLPPTTTGCTRLREPSGKVPSSYKVNAPTPAPSRLCCTEKCLNNRKVPQTRYISLRPGLTNTSSVARQDKKDPPRNGMMACINLRKTSVIGSPW